MMEFKKWGLTVLKESKKDNLHREIDHLRKSQIFDNNIKLEHIPVVSALINVISKRPVSEA
ncbi:hypothetical protein A3Q56_05486 [Intoshia linei]|uniref:Uncharacterized protein n=1 Tax=Intoshia linei TaxID=1819745 RepID=A0A177AZ54_9BILA|nr:hypothetical protein A3Q56_05486 [Intoshia linei]